MGEARLARSKHGSYKCTTAGLSRLRSDHDRSNFKSDGSLHYGRRHLRKQRRHIILDQPVPGLKATTVAEFVQSIAQCHVLVEQMVRELQSLAITVTIGEPPSMTGELPSFCPTVPKVALELDNILGALAVAATAEADFLNVSSVAIQEDFFIGTLLPIIQLYVTIFSIPSAQDAAGISPATNSRSDPLPCANLPLADTATSGSPSLELQYPLVEGVCFKALCALTCFIQHEEDILQPKIHIQLLSRLLTKLLLSSRSYRVIQLALWCLACLAEDSPFIALRGCELQQQSLLTSAAAGTAARTASPQPPSNSIEESRTATANLDSTPDNLCGDLSQAGLDVLSAVVERTSAICAELIQALQPAAAGVTTPVTTGALLRRNTSAAAMMVSQNVKFLKTQMGSRTPVEGSLGFIRVFAVWIQHVMRLGRRMIEASRVIILRSHISQLTVLLLERLLAEIVSPVCEDRRQGGPVPLDPYDGGSSPTIKKPLGSRTHSSSTTTFYPSPKLASPESPLPSTLKPYFEYSEAMATLPRPDNPLRQAAAELLAAVEATIVTAPFVLDPPEFKTIVAEGLQSLIPYNWALVYLCTRFLRPYTQYVAKDDIETIMPPPSYERPSSTNQGGTYLLPTSSSGSASYASELSSPCSSVDAIGESPCGTPPGSNLTDSELYISREAKAMVLCPMDPETSLSLLGKPLDLLLPSLGITHLCCSSMNRIAQLLPPPNCPPDGMPNPIDQEFCLKPILTVLQLEFMATGSASLHANTNEGQLPFPKLHCYTADTYPKLLSKLSGGVIAATLMSEHSAVKQSGCLLLSAVANSYAVSKEVTETLVDFVPLLCLNLSLPEPYFIHQAAVEALFHMARHPSRGQVALRVLLDVDTRALNSPGCNVPVLRFPSAGQGSAQDVATLYAGILTQESFSTVGGCTLCGGTISFVDCLIKQFSRHGSSFDYMMLCIDFLDLLIEKVPRTKKLLYYHGIIEVVESLPLALENDSIFQRTVKFVSQHFDDFDESEPLNSDE